MKTLTKLILTASLVSLLLYCKEDENEDPLDQLVGWAAGSTYDGYGVILNTTDGGKTWTRQGTRDVILDVNIDFISAITENLVWACGDSIDGMPTILKTTDGGKNWTRIGLTRDIPAVTYGGISGVGENIAWAVGQNNVIIKTTDGGLTWTRQNEGADPAFDLASIAVVDENHVWAAGGSNFDPFIAYITYTSDGGEHWYRQGENDIPVEVVGFIDIHAISPNDAWAVGTGQGALRTKDGGQTWEAMQTPGGLAHNNGVCMVDKDNVWMATDYSEANFYSESTGQWTNFHLPTSTHAIWPVTIGTTAISKDKVWMVTSAGGNIVQGEIFYTDNGGTTWTKQEIPVISMLRRITFPDATR
jgi:photosystem II stability/assembly factor-like uncharacterized protein